MIPITYPKQKHSDTNYKSIVETYHTSNIETKCTHFKPYTEFIDTIYITNYNFPSHTRYRNQ